MGRTSQHISHQSISVVNKHIRKDALHQVSLGNGMLKKKKKDDTTTHLL